MGDKIRWGLLATGAIAKAFARGLKQSQTGTLVAVATSVFFALSDFQMPPPPGNTRGYLLNITVDPLVYGLTLVAMIAMAMLASAWIARKTVNAPIVTALAHT